MLNMKISKVANRTAIYNPSHPKANNRGYILYSRHLMENKIERYLKSDEIVHHINKNNLDNRIENLMIVSNNEHLKIHGIGFEFGHKPVNRILNDKDAKMLKEMIKKRNKLSLRKLADLLGFKHSLLQDVSAGRSYINI